MMPLPPTTTPTVWPRPLRGINQIELSSVCQLRCPYCAYPDPKLMTRPKIFMSDEVFERVLVWIKYFLDQGTQGREIGFAGIGEGTLDPQLPERVARIRKLVGPNRRLSMASNGIAITPGLALALAESDLRVSVSMHEPRQAVHGIQALRAAGILEATTCDPAVAPNTWAGQIDWVEPTYKIACQYLGQGLGFVTSQGDILVCTLDCKAENVLANVSEVPHRLMHAPWRCCKDCYQTFPE